MLCYVIKLQFKKLKLL